MKREAEIVNWSNDLTDLPFKNFTASELDIFLAICYKCQRQKSDLVKIKLSELERLGNFNAYGKQRLGACVENMIKKLIKLYFVDRDDKHYDCFTLFTRFKTNYEDGFIEISVNEPFIYLLNELKSNYTSIEILEHASLASVYSKVIYKKLRQFRNQRNPYWVVSMDDFRRLLCIPEGYRMCDIDNRVLSTAQRELSELFTDLKITKLYAKPNGKRGRNKVNGLKFSYTASQADIQNKVESSKLEDNELDLDDIPF